MLPDVPASTLNNDKQAWIDYRQQLRDFPPTITDINAEIVYPTAPPLTNGGSPPTLRSKS